MDDTTPPPTPPKDAHPIDVFNIDYEDKAAINTVDGDQASISSSPFSPSDKESPSFDDDSDYSPSKNTSSKRKRSKKATKKPMKRLVKGDRASTIAPSSSNTLDSSALEDLGDDTLQTEDEVLANWPDDSDLKSYHARMGYLTSVFDSHDRQNFYNQPASDVGQAYTPRDTIETDSGLIVPKYVYAHLFDHQKESLEWLHKLHEEHVGGILGDDMGLGKTVQIAAFMAAMHAAHRLPTVSLLLAPASVLLQWVRELHKWAPHLRVCLMHSSSQSNLSYADLLGSILPHPSRREPDPSGVILLTTYENVRSYQDLLLEVEWDYVILDEGHKIRNPDAEITLVCKQLRTPHRIILTGTPIQNHLRELWSLFDFVFPGKLGTLPTFEDEFVLPIRSGGYANASKMQVVMAYKCALVLKDLIAPYFLRRSKQEAALASSLPQKHEHILFCNLSERQTTLYQQYLASNEVALVIRREIRPFRAIGMLRHICNHPDLFRRKQLKSKDDSDEEFMDEWDETKEEASGKMQVLVEVLRIWKQQKHRVLLFTQTRQMLDMLEGMLQYHHYAFCRLDGTTPVKQRQKLLDEFNDPSSPYFIFLLTTRAGGLGVNLTGADRVVVFDPDWNPSTDVQARERAWRLGQQKDVTIYRLITSGTIEEKIYHRQLFKQYLTSKVLQDAKRKRVFNKHTLRELFTLDAPNAKTDASKTQASSKNELTGLVETSALAYAGHLPDPTEQKEEQKEEEDGDNDAVLKHLFTNYGDQLQGAFDHNVLEADGVANQEASLIEMESEKIAKAALEALRYSSDIVRNQQTAEVSQRNRFVLTWTGKQGTAGDPSEEEKKRAGVVGGRAQARSSKALLAKMKKRKEGVGSQASAFDRMRQEGGKELTPSQLTRQLQAYLTMSGNKEKGVSTQQILDTFGNSVSVEQKVVFRELLRKMAVNTKGKWKLKKEYGGIEEDK